MMNSGKIRLFYEKSGANFKARNISLKAVCVSQWPACVLVLRWRTLDNEDVSSHDCSPHVVWVA
jgi:hypothetical protein